MTGCFATFLWWCREFYNFLLRQFYMQTSNLLCQKICLKLLAEFTLNSLLNCWSAGTQGSSQVEHKHIGNLNSMGVKYCTMLNPFVCVCLFLKGTNSVSLCSNVESSTQWFAFLLASVISFGTFSMSISPTNPFSSLLVFLRHCFHRINFFSLSFLSEPSSLSVLVMFVFGCKGQVFSPTGSVYHILLTASQDWYCELDGFIVQYHGLCLILHGFDSDLSDFLCFQWIRKSRYAYFICSLCSTELPLVALVSSHSLSSKCLCFVLAPALDLLQSLLDYGYILASVVVVNRNNHSWQLINCQWC